MADIKFEHFDIRNGDWESYKERFGYFLIAHGITESIKQKAVFFASCGSDLYDLVKSLVFPDCLSQVTLINIETKLDNHFSPRPNEIVESFKFYNRNQGKNESMQDYIATLRKMCKFCNFVDLERTLRDRLVCGVHDVKLQESLLNKANLTYASAVELALQAEKCVEDLKVLKVPVITNSPINCPISTSSQNDIEPLYRLLDKDAVWKWDKLESETFNKAKCLRSSRDTLVHFDNNRKVTLTCDASEYGVGAVLSHIMDDGSEKPIGMGSRTFSKSELNYAQIDKEAAAIMFGLEKFGQYLYGRHFIIYTDHKPLLGIFSPNKAIPKVLSPRMMRLALKLNSHHYDLIYKCGSSIKNADALSRWPMNTEEVETNTVDGEDILLLSETPSAVQYSAKDIAELTGRDEILSKVKFWILHGWPDSVKDMHLKLYWLKRRELSITNDCIIWGTRVVIPPPMREHMLKALHETHDGIVISKSIARSYFWWPGLDHEIEALVSDCDACQINRNLSATTAHSWITPSNPWQRLHIDFAGPVDRRIYLIAVDTYSKWPEIKIVKSTSTECAIRALREIFAEQGLPEVLVSNNATAFTSEEFKNFMKCNAIKHVLVPPYSPSLNGQAERFVQIIKRKLLSIAGTDINIKLPRILFNLRVAPSSVTGKSPAEMLNKRRFKTRFDIIHPFSSKPVAERQIESNKEVPVRAFRLKDKVWLRNYSRGEKWVKGEIFRIKGPVRFLVKINNGPIVTRHVNQLRSRVSDEAPGCSDEMREILGIPSHAVVTCEGDMLQSANY